MKTIISALLGILLPVFCIAQQKTGTPPGTMKILTTCPMYIYSAVGTAANLKIDSIPAGTCCYAVSYKKEGNTWADRKYLWHVYYNKKSGFLVDSALTYTKEDNLLLQTAPESDDTKALQNVSAYFESSVLESPVDTPTGFWEAKFGSTPEETVKLIEKKTSITPTGVKLYGKAIEVKYEKCIWDGIPYTSAYLLFYNDRLCGGMFETPETEDNFRSVTVSLQRLFGVPFLISEKRFSWVFADKCNIEVNTARRGQILVYIGTPENEGYREELIKQVRKDSIQLAEKSNQETAKLNQETPKDVTPKNELTGFWNVKFGQDIEAVTNTIKTSKKYTPIKRKTLGKTTSLYYTNCVFGTDKCSIAVLTFYDKKLCGGHFTISCDGEREKEIIKAIYDKYGAAKVDNAKGCIWNFDNGNGVFVYQADVETTEILYTRNKEFELYSKERDKQQTADY